MFTFKIHLLRRNDIIKILIISVFTLICQATDAQVRLTGKITDKINNEAIPGATVFIPELRNGAIADKDGIYTIENLPKTNVIIQVSFLGYKSITENIGLSGSTTMNFSLEQAVTEINEVVVTGTSRATEIIRSPVPVITVNNRELLQNLNTNIIDAIAKLPGVSAVTTGPNISKPFIHGLGYNRVLTLFDGIRQEGQQWGAEHGIEIDENSVERIEVVKGPASLIYGPDALAGVINIIPVPPVPAGTIKGHAEVNYHTNNRLIETHAALGGNNNNVYWGAEASHKQATNYKNKYDGRVFGTAFNENDISAFAGLSKKWGYSNFNFSLFNDLQEVPDGSRDSLTRKFTKQISAADTFRPIVSDRELNSYSIDVLHQHISHYRIYSTNNLILGPGKLGLNIGYQKNIRREFSHPEYPSVPGLFLYLRSFTYDIKYSLPAFMGWETSFGLNGMYQVNSNKGTEFIIPDYRLFDIGPFALFTRSFNKLDISGGIRFDSRFYNNEEMFVKTDPSTGFEIRVNSTDTLMAENIFHKSDHTFSGISASFGAAYNFSKNFFLKANVARGFRSPNIAEISANGVHPGTLIYQIGNDSFKPEFSLQEDIELSYRSDHISGEVDVFNNNISNYIFNRKLLDQNGMDSIIIRGNQTFRFQQSKAQLFGGEANIDIHPYDWLHFENSISVIYGLSKDDYSRYLPLIPPLHTNTELKAAFKNVSRRLSNFYIRAGIEYYGKQNRVYTAYNTETPTPGYTLVNAGIGADVVNKNKKTVVSINIMAKNITGLAYQSHLSRLKYFEEFPDNPSGRKGIYEMGRNVSFKFTFPMDFR